jgi:membrane-associated phospholipid phosphatase
METSHKPTILKIVLICVYFAVVIATEPFYRNVLFDLSVTKEKEWQADVSDTTLAYLKTLTHIGYSKEIFLIILFAVHTFYPICKSWALLSVFTYSIFLLNLLKMIYGNSRPFWEDHSLKIDCEGTWGNPSGHALLSTAFYLSLWHIATDMKYFQKHKLARFLTGKIVILFVLGIMQSRLVLGAHSINQVLYGGLLGIGVHVLVFHVLNLDKIRGHDFFDMFRDYVNMLVHLVTYFTLLILSFVIYATVKYDTTPYEAFLREDCGLKEMQMFSNPTMSGCIMLLTQIGAYLGLLFIAHFISSQYSTKELMFNKWNYYGETWVQIFRFLICLAMLFPMAFYFAVSSEANKVVIFIFKEGFSFFLIGLTLYGLSIYLSVKLRVCNPKILANPDNEMKKVEIVSKI